MIVPVSDGVNNHLHPKCYREQVAGAVRALYSMKVVVSRFETTRDFLVVAGGQAPLPSVEVWA